MSLVFIQFRKPDVLLYAENECEPTTRIFIYEFTVCSLRSYHLLNRVSREQNIYLLSKSTRVDINTTLDPILGTAWLFYLVRPFRAEPFLNGRVNDEQCCNNLLVQNGSMSKKDVSSTLPDFHNLLISFARDL